MVKLDVDIFEFIGTKCNVKTFMFICLGFTGEIGDHIIIYSGMARVGDLGIFRYSRKKKILT